MGVSPFLYTNIQHISAKSKCPPSGLEISLLLIFYTWQPLAQNSEKICAAWSHAKAQSFAKRLRSSAVSACNNFHTELKVAVRTCEGKAIHGIHRKVSTYLQVSARMFFSHEWTLIYTNAERSVVVSRKVAKYRKVSATKICPYVLLYNKLINSWNTDVWRIVIFTLILGAQFNTSI